MSEIKVGDKALGYTGNRIYHSSVPFIGIVTDVAGNHVKLDSIDYWFHRKQCRKLVKVKKCDGCKGKGGVKLNLGQMVNIVCPKCKGSGKVKIS